MILIPPFVLYWFLFLCPYCIQEEYPAEKLRRRFNSEDWRQSCRVTSIGTKPSKYSPGTIGWSIDQEHREVFADVIFGNVDVSLREALDKGWQNDGKRWQTVASGGKWWQVMASGGKWGAEWPLAASHAGQVGHQGQHRPLDTCTITTAPLLLMLLPLPLLLLLLLILCLLLLLLLDSTPHCKS